MSSCLLNFTYEFNQHKLVSVLVVKAPIITSCVEKITKNFF